MYATILVKARHWALIGLSALQLSVLDASDCMYCVGLWALPCHSDKRYPYELANAAWAHEHTRHGLMTGHCHGIAVSKIALPRLCNDIITIERKHQA